MADYTLPHWVSIQDKTVTETLGADHQTVNPFADIVQWDSYDTAQQNLRGDVISGHFRWTRSSLRCRRDDQSARNRRPPII